MEQTSALLVMDMQVSILSNLADARPVVAGVASAIAAARKISLQVIYVVSGFRKGAPELSKNNKFYAANAAKYQSGDPAYMLSIHPDIAPQAEDIIVGKRRFGAFEGTDLELVLRSLGVNHIILAGFSTGGVILSTIRSAADKDYRITLLADACADADEEVHHILLAKVFPRQADIITIKDWEQKKQNLT